MKSWIKGMLIGSAICLVAGGAICVGGWAMGGRFRYFRTRNLGLVEQIGWEEEKPEAVEEAVTEHMWDIHDSVHGEAHREEHDDWEATVAEGTLMTDGTEIRELEVTVSAGRVALIADDTVTQVVVSSGNEEYRCRQKIDGDKLEIHISPSREGFWGKYEPELWEEIAAVIQVPAGFEFEELELELNAGLLEAREVTAKKLDMEVNAGQIVVTDGTVQELKGECRAGELTYQGQVNQKMKAECLAGKIGYVLDGDEEDFNYRMEVSGGAIAIDGDVKGSLQREIEKKYPGAEKKAELECKGGMISVDFQ